MFKTILLLSSLAIFGFASSLHFIHKDGASAAKEARDPETNYKDYCAGCHGEHMNAFVDRRWKHGSSDDSLFHAIKVGYPDKGMPGFDTTFTDQEIRELVQYIQTGIRNVNRYQSNNKPTSNLFTTSAGKIRLDTVVQGLASPWGLAFLPGGEMLVTDKKGQMYRVNKKGIKTAVEGVPAVVSEGQGGLMDVILHPQYAKNKTIYLSYSLGKQTENGIHATTAIARARLDGNRLSDVKNIFVAEPYSRTRHHYGCRLQFGKDGYLYITIGDRGNEKQNPQALENDLGKVHRIRDDGSIPPDNPFVNTPGARASIYSYGHRNPQGMALHPKTGAVWTHEHGPRGGDELNLVQKKKNFGWPVTSYGINYNGTVITKTAVKEGIEPPAHYWIPSIGPSGMAFITSDRYRGWKNHLLVGSLRFQYLNLCKLNGNKVTGEEILFKNIGRVREVRMSPDGYIYMTVENPGFVYKLVPVR